MTHGMLLMVLGVLVALSPFSGLPPAWLEFIIPILGIVIVLIGYLMRPRRIEAPQALVNEKTA